MGVKYIEKEQPKLSKKVIILLLSGINTKKGDWSINCLERSESLRRATGPTIASSGARGSEEETDQPIASSEARG